MPPSPPADPVVVTPAVLRARPLPDHGAATNKQERGQVLVVGGSTSTPGAVLLAGVGALRVGGGKLQVATVGSAATALGLAVPEAGVVALPGTGSGAIAPSAATTLRPLVAAADAVLFGTGAMDAEATGALLVDLVDSLDGAVLVVDAGALPAVGADPSILAGAGGRAVVMPNPGEMAALTGDDDADVDAVFDDPRAAVTRRR